MCDMFARVLEANASEEKLRQTIATASGFEQSLWSQIAELGLTGILIDAEHGGVGGGLEEVEALMEVMGKYLLNGPFINTCVIAPTLFAACSDSSLSAPFLKEIAAGTTCFAVAGCGKTGDWTLAPDVTAAQRNGEWALHGQACFVSYANVADYALVYASTDVGVEVFLVSIGAPGLETIHHNADDRTQRLSTLRFEGVTAILLGGVDAQAQNLALNSVLVALAGEQVGGSQHIFELTVDYLKTRHQFGQPIGRFQALKHMAADLLVELESATSAARHAAAVIALDGEQATQVSYLAAFTCGDNFRKLSSDAIQMHGGIAYTIEHSAHLYWRRAQSGQWAYCSSDRLRDLYLTEMEKTL